jgi:multiple sugar transport system substrate-binding protein
VVAEAAHRPALAAAAVVAGTSWTSRPSAPGPRGHDDQLARFFGDCEDTAGTETDVAKATNECETIQILTNAFNAENEHGITVERLGGAAWDTYYDALNSAYAGDGAPDVAVMHGSR